LNTIGTSTTFSNNWDAAHMLITRDCVETSYSIYDSQKPLRSLGQYTHTSQELLYYLNSLFYPSPLHLALLLPRLHSTYVKRDGERRRKST
jgi:hypothetical protein